MFAMEKSADISSKTLSVRKFLLVNMALLFLLGLCVFAGSVFGPGGFHLSDLFPLDPNSNPVAATVLWLRLPRTLLAALVGMALGAVGVAFQSFLRNPLADPFIMGVSGGAALGGTLSMVLLGGLGVGIMWQAPAAFIGATLATVLVYRMGMIGGRIETTTILLVGVVFNSFASAIIMFLKAVVTATKAQEMLFWLMGTLGSLDYWTLLILAVGVAAGIVVLYFHTSSMNALSLGEHGAAHLGVNVERAKIWVFLAASLLTGLAVSVSGLIGFVGLIVPHLCRLLFGPDHRLLLPSAALCGGAFLVLADLLARLLFIALGTEPPVGVITAFVGGPFFLFLLRKRHKTAFMG